MRSQYHAQRHSKLAVYLFCSHYMYVDPEWFNVTHDRKNKPKPHFAVH